MNSVRSLLVLYFFTLLIQGCSESGVYPVKRSHAATIWADLTLETIRKTPSNSPTFTSRNLGYIGITMYESVVNGSVESKSMLGNLQDLEALPLIEPGAEYNWTLSLNAGQAQIIKNIYAHMPESQMARIDSTEDAIYEYELLTTDPVVAERSSAYGRAIADAIFEWSKTDGGHEGYKNQFDPAYDVPEGDGKWVPATNGQVESDYPLHPYWGENRTFAVANSTLGIPKAVPYSTDEGSNYYKEYKAVYDKSLTRTAEEKRIAAWWLDDATQTFSAPGHSYNLATLVIRKTRADIFQGAEAYAKVGMCVADAYINSWKAKYKYHTERPFPYIAEHFDEAYAPFLPEPPYPAFTSANATQSAAAAEAIESVFGNNISVTDNTHTDRKPDLTTPVEYRARKFSTIMEIAEECALSGFLAGINTTHDTYEGQKQGKIIGRNITGLDWKF